MSYGDINGNIVSNWQAIHADARPRISFPFTDVYTETVNQFLLEQPMSLLSRITDEVSGYYIFVVSTFLLTSLSTYYIFRKLSFPRFSSLLACVVFALCPAAIFQGALGGHASFSFNPFIPLLFLVFLCYREHRPWRWAVCMGVCWALITLSSLYFGYFTLFIMLFFAAYDVLDSKDSTTTTPACKIAAYAVATCVATLLILPFEYKEVMRQLGGNAEHLASIGHRRDLLELFIGSSRPWEFFIPSIDHPILGNYVIDFARDHLHGSNLFEQTLYLGFVPLGLWIAGLVLFWHKRLGAQHEQYFKLFSLGFLWMLFLTLPPMLEFAGARVPTVSYFAYKIAPMFRVYARFQILAMFFLAGAVAVVLTHLQGTMSARRFYPLFAALLSLLLFEYCSIWPGTVKAESEPPAVYTWLAQEPADSVVVEYPMARYDEAAYYNYPYWQRIHKKNLVNGATPENPRAWDFYLKIRDPTDPRSAALLQSIGVTHVLVHRQMYRDGQIPAAIKRYYPKDVAAMNYGVPPSLRYPYRLIKDFGEDQVYRLEKMN